MGVEVGRGQGRKSPTPGLIADAVGSGAESSAGSTTPSPRSTSKPWPTYRAFLEYEIQRAREMADWADARGAAITCQEYRIRSACFHLALAMFNSYEREADHRADEGASGV